MQLSGVTWFLHKTNIDRKYLEYTYNSKINNGQIIAEKRPSMAFLSSAICKFAQSWWSNLLTYFIMYSLKIHAGVVLLENKCGVYSSHVNTTWA